ncbi:MAG TPA: hypothetical protein VM598_03600 [Bdellovibrionota bacterium]|nr:hypothetical protein [Bdellovibrionota bacterium]
MSRTSAFALLALICAAWSLPASAAETKTPELAYLERVVALSGQRLSPEAKNERFDQARAEYAREKAAFEGESPSSVAEVEGRLGDAAVTIGLVAPEQSTQFVADAHRYEELMRLHPDGKMTGAEKAELRRIQASYKSTGHQFGSDIGVCLFGYGLVGAGLLLYDAGFQVLPTLAIVLGAFGVYACHE